MTSKLLGIVTFKKSGLRLAVHEREPDICSEKGYDGERCCMFSHSKCGTLTERMCNEASIMFKEAPRDNQE